MNALIILGWYGIAFGAMFIGSLFGMWKSSRKYYKALILPSLAPPPSVFGIIWSILYTLIGTTGWLYQDHNNNEWDATLTWLIAFIGTSTLFPFFFFFIKDNFVSFMIMVASFALSITTVYFLFYNYLLSGYFFLPTVIWVAFATYLQLEILVNNREGYYTMDEIMISEESIENQQPVSRLRAPPYRPSSQKSSMFDGDVRGF